MRISVFNTPRAKRFAYNPRYYDSRKEMREERERRILREIENEAGADQGNYTPVGKVELAHQLRFKRPESRRISRSGFLLRVITFVLALTVALLVFYGTWVLVKLV